VEISANVSAAVSTIRAVMSKARGGKQNGELIKQEKRSRWEQAHRIRTQWLSMWPLP